MDHIELVAENFGLSKRSVQRIKAEDAIRFISMVTWILTQKIGLDTEDLEKFYQNGITNHIIQDAIYEKNLHNLLHSDSGHIKTTIQGEQQEQIMQRAIKEIEDMYEVPELLYAKNEELQYLKYMSIYNATKHRYKVDFLGQISLYHPQEIMHNTYKPLTVEELKEKIHSLLEEKFSCKTEKPKKSLLVDIFIKVNKRWRIEETTVSINTKKYTITLFDKIKEEYLTIGDVTIPHDYFKIDQYIKLINLVENKKEKEKLIKQWKWLKDLAKQDDDAMYIIDQNNIERDIGGEGIILLDNIIQAVCQVDFNFSDVISVKDDICGIYQNKFGKIESRLLPKYRDKTVELTDNIYIPFEVDYTPALQ